MKPSIVSIGAGKVASNIIPALYKKGYPVHAVYSQTLNAAEILARKLPTAAFTDDIRILPRKADIYIISLTDDAIPAAVEALEGTGSLVIHTAGSIGLNVFSGKIINYGVIYPLQTFTKITDTDFNSIPLLLEASNEETLKKIREIGADLSKTLIETNSEDRRWIHTAAIFACNFTNFMFTCAGEVLHSRNFPFDILAPLITETVKNAITHNPANVQTGPAVRGDIKIVQNHISMLNDKPELQKIYTFVSRMIMEYNHKLTEKP